MTIEKLKITEKEFLLLRCEYKLSFFRAAASLLSRLHSWGSLWKLMVYNDLFPCNKNTKLILGRSSLCFQNSLRYSWHRFYKILETLRFWSMLTELHHAIPVYFSGALSYCDSPVLPRLKDLLMASDLVTGKATEELCTFCHVQFKMSFALWYGALSCWK